MLSYEKRHYQSLMRQGRLAGFSVRVKETDLHIQAEKNLAAVARESILRHRAYLEAYIGDHPEFAGTLIPWPLREPMPGIVDDMVSAGRAAGVGPMAAVAGAMAARVGRDLLRESGQVIVENGGDVFIRSDSEVTVALYAGTSPFSLKMGIALDGGLEPMAVCTSSATVGHSLSFGKADAVTVVSRGCALADAVATAVCNRVKRPEDIDGAIETAMGISGVMGVVIVLGEKAGFGGNIRLVPIREKKV